MTATDRVGNATTAERTVARVQITKYYYHGGQRVALRRAGVVYYLHTDHLGSTSLTTDAAGNVVARRRYAPYGAYRWAAGTLPTDFTFTGQRDVPGTGLIYYRARYYHPALGRFVQADTIVPDPYNPQLFNRYTYAANNPLRYNDPDGHCGPLCWIGLALGLTGIALSVNASQPLPPEQQPSDIQGVVGMGLIFAGLGLQTPDLIAPLLCADGDCTNEADETLKIVENYHPSDATHLEQFAQEAPIAQAERGLQSFGQIWSMWGKLASQSSDVADDLFLY